MSSSAVKICAVAVPLLAALFLLSWLADGKGYENLLLVQPAQLSVPGWDSDRLEEFSQEEFLLTYEIRKAASVQAVNARHQVTLIGTNPNYANVLSYILLDGGFFTEAAMEAKNRHVVLNETAAFQIFGGSHISGSTLKLDGEIWIVTGVIQDHDVENARLYAPASVTGGQVSSLMVLMDASVTEAYAKNALKALGIHDSGYSFLNLSKSAEAFGERFAVSWKVALLAVILILSLRAGGRLMERLRFYRVRMRELYLRELIRCHWPDILKAGCGLLLFAGGVIAALALSLQNLEICLTWQELLYITGEMAAGDFAGKLSWLRDFQMIGYCLFGGCVCLIILGFVMCLRRITNGAGPKPRLRNFLKKVP